MTDRPKRIDYRLFGEFVDRIVAGEAVDPDDYPAEFSELTEFARTLTAETVDMSDDSRDHIREELLRQARARFDRGYGVWPRLARLALSPVATAGASAAAVFLVIAAGVWGYNDLIDGQVPLKPSVTEVRQFESAQEFREYMLAARERQTGISRFFGGAVMREGAAALSGPAEDAFQLGDGRSSGGSRVSGTNVQVVGVDEPDIVKTDGENIYLSKDLELGILGEDIGERGLVAPPESAPEVVKRRTDVIKALPPTDLAVTASVGQSGELLLWKDVLVVISDRQITARNVSDPGSLAAVWSITLDTSTSIVTSRLIGDRMYFVTRTVLGTADPCEITLLESARGPLTVDCTEIFHPMVPTAADATFSVLAVDAASGTVEKQTSFLGSQGQSVVYVSRDAAYVTYSYAPSLAETFPDLIRDVGQGLVAQEIISELSAVQRLDIGDAAKLVEMESVWQSYLNSLDSAEKSRVENRLAERAARFVDRNKRNLERTGIVKLSLDNLVVEATGSVPGRPLNQFALDQHDGYLRVATTVGEGGFVGLGSLSFGVGGSSANDVYVLDGDLDLAGSVTGLGLTERIYSARFVGDTGYLVTFRQIDPFYVLDLSDPRNPKRTGELKIPGFSSYLHPVGANHVIGVGRENNGVKVSLFDVADPTRPAEADKLILDSVVSDVLENHRAFLIDEKHSVFFVPGSPNGYVISYSGGVLKIVKELAGSGFRRALFIDDYLYVISDSQITVLDENDWETVGGLDLNE